MAHNGSSNARAKLLEFVASALKEHESEIDRLIDRLERNKANLVATTSKLNSRFDQIVQKVDRIQSQVQQLK